jgi:hypothetical protein
VVDKARFGIINRKVAKDKRILPLMERRSGLDRRSKTLGSLVFPGKRRRRIPKRRASDRIGYVDYYDLRTWLVTTAILTLSLLDGILTGLQLHQGLTSEANPLMRAVLDRGGLYLFLSVKAALTALPLSVIILHKNWALGRSAARLCLWSYILVAIYHIVLVTQPVG